jgi:hypothetical protein
MLYRYNDPLLSTFKTKVAINSPLFLKLCAFKWRDLPYFYISNAKYRKCDKNTFASGRLG